MHGGNYMKYPDIKWDFSININPNVPNCLRSISYSIHEYPDLCCTQLKKALSRYHQISSRSILCTHGASEAIMGIVHALHPKKALLIAPTFSGYQRALQAVNCTIAYHILAKRNDFQWTEEYMDSLEKENPDIIFLCNPNNPTGKIINKEGMLKIFTYCLKNHIYMVVDECFLPFVQNGNTMIKTIYNNPYLIIVRAFTKIFGIPGIRLGYLVTSNGKLYTSIQNQLPEWNVSAQAQSAGCTLLKEKNFIEKTQKETAKERAYCISSLRKMGIDVIEGDANFLLFYSSQTLFTSLLKKKILIRDCSDFMGLKKGYYRIGIKSHKENVILMETLESAVR